MYINFMVKFSGASQNVWVLCVCVCVCVWSYQNYIVGLYVGRTRHCGVFLHCGVNPTITCF